MLPKTFSWKLLPHSTRIWLFPAAQAEENHLSQTHPFTVPSQNPSVVLFLPLKLHPCPCRSPCPHQPCRARDDVTGERSSFPALHQPVWAQQSASCSSDFPWKKFIPLSSLLPSDEKGGKQIPSGARAGRVMTPHLEHPSPQTSPGLLPASAETENPARGMSGAARHGSPNPTESPEGMEIALKDEFCFPDIARFSSDLFF